MTVPSPAEMALFQTLGLVALAVGGALGASARLLLDRRLPRRGILASNTLAALMLGLTLGLAVADLLGGRAVLGTALGSAVLVGGSLVSGFLLALGTWSTVAGRAADAVLAERWGEATRIWATHLGLGLAAVVGGWAAGRALSLALA